MEQIGMRPAASGCHAPVDAPHVITRCVEAHFLKFEAAPAMQAAMRTLQEATYARTTMKCQMSRRPSQREQVLEGRQLNGAGTLANNSSTHFCGVIPRACAE
jgi:hypothetical protein